MSEDVCRSCGKPLPSRMGKPGRSSVYCSGACRQRAHRSRQAAPGEQAVRELIAEVQRRVQLLVPQPPEVFYSEVTALSSSIGRLRRIARSAHDAARIAVVGRRPRTAVEIVTPETVTNSTNDSGPHIRPDEEQAAAAFSAVRSGDESMFAQVVEPYRPELQVHCYRMVGSYDDAEDLVQETFLKAWRRRDGFEGRSTVRAWLYRIATNACLDFLRRHTRRPQHYEALPGMEHGSGEPPARVTWLQPYPDRLLEGVVADEVGPDAAVVSKETMELVFLTAIQHLPPRQRAVLILRDVLGWPATETAELLKLSVPAVNSALQRARPTIRGHLPERRTEWTASETLGREERAIVRRYMAAAERGDISAMAELLSEDARLTMPPNPLWFVGRSAILSFVAPVFDSGSPQYLGRWRHLPTRANGQPALAGYVQRPGTTVYRAQNLDVIRIADGKIVEITTFEPHLLPAFGLPLKL
ncbi:sigma-70 family RNA polymerase sigma factor [Microtetraspora fusca]|uniref:sigma-70 family RNA polymerase sigma factor n=1 Tax=Microtetraspora fusca TaxID=1997 RepID=UPI00157BD1CA|nr:sigma-70 family RNA polymerase sigma factor [Microtetraspora fusca]